MRVQAIVLLVASASAISDEYVEKVAKWREEETRVQETPVENLRLRALFEIAYSCAGSVPAGGPRLCYRVAAASQVKSSQSSNSGNPTDRAVSTCTYIDIMRLDSRKSPVRR